MKKRGYFIILFTIIAMLSLTSCNSDKECEHSWNSGEIVEEATCIKEGLIKYTCTKCDEIKSETIEKIDHSWVDATYTEPKTCSKCHITQGEDLLDAEISQLIPKITSVKIDLPSKILDFDVTWESIEKSVMLDDGTIVFNEKLTEAQLKATINVDKQVITKNITITVEMPTVNKIEYDYYYNNYYSTAFAKTLYTDAKITTRAYKGYSPLYESLDPNIISDDGKIAKSTVEQQAIMNIYVVKNGVAILYPTDVTISDYSNDERFEFTLTELNVLIEQLKNGEINNLPFYNETYDVTLSWQSDVPDLIVLKNSILLPIEKTNVYLKCTMTRNNGKETTSDYTKYYIENIGGTSMEDYFNTWLPSLLPTEIIAHKNIVYDKLGDGQLFFLSQYAVNTGSVLNLISGKDIEINQDYYIDTNASNIVKHYTSATHPSISTDPNNSDLQKVYEHFYDGYTIPNKENILWIVVHESGMAYEGSDSKSLATIQYNRAMGTSAYTQASWHYQVDEKGIYQSYNDNVYAWHAGGDYGKYLPYRNSNSVGIEMCVNQDGNYDGAMAHDAKLVATLMHRYNLTMDNVVRHHDTSGKDCPAYMLATNRYEEFLEKVSQEYIALKYLKDATVKWTISNPELFTEGPNGLYYQKSVITNTDVQITLEVTKGNYHFKQTVTLTLKPDKTTGTTNA